MTNLIHTFRYPGLIGALMLGAAVIMTTTAFAETPFATAEAAVMLAETGKQESAKEPGDVLESLDKAEASEQAEKKCMTVCEKWGEDCVINPRTGARKCRRMCKKLAQECF